MILACDARYPGSVHDSAIWQVSEIRNFLLTNYNHGDSSSHLIGDSGYPLEPFLYTPFAVAEPNSPEHKYNVAHRSSRNVIERTNGVAKTKFRCLLEHRVLHYSPDKACIIIYAGVILHNIITKHRVPEIPNSDDEFSDGEDGTS